MDFTQLDEFCVYEQWYTSGAIWCASLEGGLCNVVSIPPRIHHL